MPDPTEPHSTLLVVSDDPHIREETRFGFSDEIGVVFADDSRTAMEQMRSIVPELVLVDIQTGSAGGFSLARDMAQSPRLRAIPIFMLLERAQDGWLARQAGAALHRVKPIETEELVRSVLDLMSRVA
ncbi:MAG TPA: response regulator [Actinomycetota bacterium]|nr:response regulator [Actinomycetota bacterium]